MEGECRCEQQARVLGDGQRHSLDDPNGAFARPLVQCREVVGWIAGEPADLQVRQPGRPRRVDHDGIPEPNPESRLDLFDMSKRRQQRRCRGERLPSSEAGNLLELIPRRTVCPRGEGRQHRPQGSARDQERGTIDGSNPSRREGVAATDGLVQGRFRHLPQRVGRVPSMLAHLTAHVRNRTPGRGIGTPPFGNEANITGDPPSERASWGPTVPGRSHEFEDRGERTQAVSDERVVPGRPDLPPKLSRLAIAGLALVCIATAMALAGLIVPGALYSVPEWLGYLLVPAFFIGTLSLIVLLAAGLRIRRSARRLGGRSLVTAGLLIAVIGTALMGVAVVMCCASGPMVP